MCTTNNINKYARLITSAFNSLKKKKKRFKYALGTNEMCINICSSDFKNIQQQNKNTKKSRVIR